jgi:SAM-dependent methyltransferase
MSAASRVTDYDRIADRFDTRYRHYAYDGVRETLLDFLGPEPSSVLEVGCGTGHWLTAAREARPSLLAGIDPSLPMLARARAAAPSASLVQARAEDLPWRDASFDRVFCVNSLHHFTDRARSRRSPPGAQPGGVTADDRQGSAHGPGRLRIYQYFEETRAIDRERFARVRRLRGEMAPPGSWTESMEADHTEVVRRASEALVNASSIRASRRS